MTSYSRILSLTSDLKQIGEEYNQLGLVGHIEHKAVQGAGNQVGDAERGQAESVEPLLPAHPVEVVPHGGEDDAVLDPSGQKEHGHRHSRGPRLHSRIATAP